MTISELEQRVAALERTVGRIVEAKPASSASRWWIEAAGRFEGNPVFDEIVKLGRAYRTSLGPDGKNRVKPRAAAKKNGAKRAGARRR